MPVKIPDGLPAVKVLEQENIAVIAESRAFAQDIRPLQIAIVNIMPVKSVAETQLLRLLSNSPLQVAITLLHPESHASRNTPPEHLAKFYKRWSDVKDRRFDCLIITGAPVEKLAFSDVTYWKELRDILDWSRTNVYSTLHICWAAQAGLFHYFGVDKFAARRKVFGVFQHRVLERHSELVHGFDDVFYAPHSRHTYVRRDDVVGVDGLRVVAESDEAGVYLVSTEDNRRVFVTGHPEYDRLTLKEEYERDVKKGEQVDIPVGYFPEDDPARVPIVSWRSHSNLLFQNWLNQVYQNTPFDLGGLKPVS